MRVLAIRGKNLASLQGEFEIRLDQPPLSSFGLFSISGPTGAGKSTLLDALCLALYGKTPRLRGDGGHVIGGPGDDPDACLKSNDARGILSRGAADGYAEVEFQGVDGRRYRARWEVHRARGKASGRLQMQAMAIWAMEPEEALATQLGAVRAEVERLVGFTYDEFKRTVLLPQFEFTNFLRAKADERATILEHITGGEIFSRLSVAAHERASAERDKLAEAEERLARTAVLSAEEHVELTRQRDEAEARRTAAREQVNRAERDLQWHQEHARRTFGLGEARAALARAEDQLAQAKTLEEQLGAVVAVQPLRQQHAEAVSAAAEQERRSTAASTAVQQLDQARTAAGAATLLLGAKEQAFQAARARAEALRPEIEEAASLDHKAEGLQRQVAESERKLGEAEANLGQAQAAVAKLDARAAALTVESGEHERWLAAHTDEQPLAAEWPRWQADLARHGDAVARLSRLGEDARVAEERLQQRRVAHATAAAQVEERRSALQWAQAELTALAAGASAQDLADAKARAAACRAQRAALAALQELGERSAKAEASRALHRASCDEGAARCQVSQERIRALGDEQNQCKVRLAEARDVLGLTQAAFGLDEHRTALRAGQPCPLCGSCDHPWARAGAPSVLAPAQQRVRELEQQETALAHELAALATEHATVEHGVTAAERQFAEAVAAAGQAQQDYAKLRGAFPTLPEQVGEAATAVAALLAAADAAALDAEAGEAALLASITRREHAQLAVEEARLEHEAVMAERDRQQAGLVEQEALVKQHDDEHRRLVEVRDGIEQGLAPVLAWSAEWVTQARQAPAAFAASLQGKVTLCKDRQDRLGQARVDLGEGRAQLATAAALVSEREQLQRGLADEHGGLSEALAQVRARRREILDGRDRTLVVQELATRLDEAERARDAARVEAQAAETKAAAAATVATTAAAALVEQEQQAEVAEQALAAALAKLGIDRATLTERLAWDEAWMASTRAALEALRGAVTTARATADERERQLQELAAQDRPERDLAACQAAHAQATDVAARSETEVVLLKARLQQDEAQQALRREQAAAARAQADQSRVWGQLDEVIGSADGKKLRIFAQGLAFHALVREANAHLADLAPRYRLRPVPGADMELQIANQDMGGELRGVNGLSGGETFLVALALALGLSALSTRATQAQTLFIDEGFGTLDRDALDHAIVALENLQATGRTVGVISHIPELHERFGAQVRVERVGVGRSRVVVTS